MILNNKEKGYSQDLGDPIVVRIYENTMKGVSSTYKIKFSVA